LETPIQGAFLRASRRQAWNIPAPAQLKTGIAFIKQLRKEVAIAAVVEDQFALG